MFADGTVSREVRRFGFSASILNCLPLGFLEKKNHLILNVLVFPSEKKMQIIAFVPEDDRGVLYRVLS